MRLSVQEVDAIVSALKKFLDGTDAELRLYGSRVDDNAKGGDIDLLLTVPNDEIARTLRYKKVDLLAAMKKLLGERKIDLTIALNDEIATDPFLELIFPKSILLHKFSV